MSFYKTPLQKAAKKKPNKDFNQPPVKILVYTVILSQLIFNHKNSFLSPSANQHKHQQC